MSYIIASILFVLIIAADQLTKFYVLANVPMANAASDSVPLIKGIIDLTHIHNYGGAWGLLGGYTWLLLGITLIVMILCITMLIKSGLKNKLLFWSVALIMAGGIGNMIDRVIRGGAVVDFLQFHFWPSFPVFNIADIAVCIGAGLLILYFLFDILKESNARKIRAKEEKDSQI